MWSSFYILGTYVPLTEEGNLVVDQIVASCYAQFNHDLANNAMKPLQWYPGIMKMIFGAEDGSPIYVTTAKEVRKWFLPNDI